MLALEPRLLHGGLRPCSPPEIADDRGKFIGRASSGLIAGTRNGSAESIDNLRDVLPVGPIGARSSNNAARLDPTSHGSPLLESSRTTCGIGVWTDP
jgi:hypothetical protein